jgi:hypothetical protein
MYDIFYFGPKPGLFPHEKFAESLEVADQLSKTSCYWYIYGGNNYSKFNFYYRPNNWEQNFTHVFGDQWQKHGYTFLVKKGNVNADHFYNVDQQCERLQHPHLFTFPKNIDPKTVATTWHPDPLETEFTYHFPSQHQRASGVTYGTGPNKFTSDVVVTALSDKTNWTVPKDIEDVDFSWHPDPTQSAFIYEFATEHQKTSGLLYTVPGATVKKYTSMTRKVKRRADTEVYLIDFMTDSTTAKLDALKNRGLVVKKTRFVGSYLDIIKRICTTATTEYIWVVTTLCDYSNFDFNWHPETWQSTMLHAFASNEQTFGDTFLVNVESFREQSDRIKLLDWYDTVHYVEDVVVPRESMPTVIYNQDTLVDAVNHNQFTDPYVLFAPYECSISHTPKLWAVKDRDVHTFTQSNSVAQVPREVRQHVSEQVYDYPYITKHKTLSESKQDIVFISYDETNADENWNKLHGRFPSSQRLHGVDGMENALRQAAEISRTPWCYMVFAKTELHPDFKFDVVPDYLQQPKHYIFHAENPMNGLCYGHMGIVMYNCDMVKSAKQFGVDYTLSFRHEVVPLVSAVARFNTNPYQTWRTAFREGAKLAQFNSQTQDVETDYRLRTWTKSANGDYAEWCTRGARDGVEFYRANADDSDALQQAFLWTWLREHFAGLYDSVDDPSLGKLQLRQANWQPL